MGALIALTATLASASTISFSDSQTTSFTPSTLTFSLSQFDPSLGTLQSVTIVYAAALYGGISVTNNSPQDGELTGTMSGNFSLDGPGALGTLIALAPSTSLGPTTVSAGSTLTLSSITATDFGAVVLTNPADLALFLGLGSLSLNGEAQGIIAPSVNFTPVVIEALLTGGAQVTITYEYAKTDVPEPSTLAMAGVGVLLICGGIQKRISSR